MSNTFDYVVLRSIKVGDKRLNPGDRIEDPSVLGKNANALLSGGMIAIVGVTPQQSEETGVKESAVNSGGAEGSGSSEPKTEGGKDEESEPTESEKAIDQEQVTINVEEETAEAVIDHAQNHPTEALAILDLEKRTKQRKTVIAALTTLVEKADDEGTK